MKRFLAALATLAAVAAAAAPGALGADLANPSFETHGKDGFAGWTGRGARPAARDWCTWSSCFATGVHGQAVVVVRAPAGGGRLWIDSVRAEGLELSDGEFSSQKPGQRPSAPWRSRGAKGAVTVTDEFALAPGPAAVLAGAGTGASVRQKVICRPGTVARLAISYRTESLGAPATIEVIGLSRRGEEGGTLLSAELGRRSRVKPGGVWCARLRASDGDPAVLSTAFRASAGENLAAILQMRGVENGGLLRVTVRPPQPGGPPHEIAEGALEEEIGIDLGGRGSAWTEAMVPFTCTRSGAYELEFRVRSGAVDIDEVRVTHPTPMPAPRSMRPARSARNFVVPDLLQIVVSGDLAAAQVGPLRSAIGHPRDRDALVTRGAGRGARGSPRVVVTCAGDRHHEALSDELGIELMEGNEAYAVRVSRDQLILAGASTAGLRHAARAVKRLATRGGPRREIVGSDISDAPAHELRGVAVTWRETGKRLYPSVERLSALGFNLLVLDCTELYSAGEDDAWKKVEDEISAARAAGMRTAVTLRSFSEAREAARALPAASAARWIFDERHVMKGASPVTLEGAEPLRSGATGLEVWGLGGERYVEGTDYVVSGTSAEYPFSAAGGRWAIRRRVGGRIADGETVICRYDCALKTSGAEARLCPAEPAGRELLRRRLGHLVKRLGPWGINLGARGLSACRCSRCTGSGRTAARLHAERLADLIEAASGAPGPAARTGESTPPAAIFSGDALDPYGPAGPGALLDSIRFLGARVRQRSIVALSCSKRMARSASYFRSHGLRPVCWTRLEHDGTCAPDGLPAPGVTDGIIFEVPRDCAPPLEPAAQAAWGGDESRR